MRVEDPADVVADLEELGFRDVEYEVGQFSTARIVSSPLDRWLVLYARKPGGGGAENDDELGRCLRGADAAVCLGR